MSVNKVMLLGNLGKDPEVKKVGDQSVCNFSIATSEKWTKDGETKEKTEWHRIVVWGKLADLCGEYLKKGRQAFIEGKLTTRSYEKDGATVYTTEVVASSVQFIGGKVAEPQDDLIGDIKKMDSGKVIPPVVAKKKPFNHAPGAVNESDELPF